MAEIAVHGWGSASTETDAIVADVLDAWFPPSPLARAAFLNSVDDIRLSPDLQLRRLTRAIGNARNLDHESISLGAGSSEIIHRVLPTLSKGKAVILDPTYSEYPYLLNREGWPIQTVQLSSANNFRVDLGRLREASKDASLVVLVNPNNPTGQTLSRVEILDFKASLPKETVLWVDEAYIDFSLEDNSAERDACHTTGLFVLKSLSKAYALSGLRAAYLVCEPEANRSVLPRVPPWIVARPTEAVVIAALSDADYYQARWRETRALVDELARRLRNLGLTVYQGAIGAVLVEVPSPYNSSSFASKLEAKGLIVRTPAGMGEVLTDRFVRIAVVPPNRLDCLIERVALCL